MTRDGFALLAMGFTGEKALQFKLGYIQEFNRMEQGLARIQETALIVGATRAMQIAHESDKKMLVDTIKETTHENNELKTQNKQLKNAVSSLVEDNRPVHNYGELNDKGQLLVKPRRNTFTPVPNSTKLSEAITAKEDELFQMRLQLWGMGNENNSN
jgi:hypothetical protein